MIRLHALMEYCASIDELIGMKFPKRFHEGVIFLIVARTSIRDWVTEGGIVTPDRIQCSVRVNGIATAYGKSPDTVGRYVRWLVANEWLLHTDKGLALSPRGDKVFGIVEFYRTMHDLFVRLGVDMAATAAMPPMDVSQQRTRSGMHPNIVRPTPVAVLTRALDVLLVPLEDDPVMREDMVAAAAWGVLFALTLRALTDVEASTPAPIAVRRIASVMQLPYATLWRKLRKLEDGGAAERSSNGWRVPSGMVDHPVMGQALKRMVADADRKVADLGWGGASKSVIEATYMIGPSPYVL